MNANEKPGFLNLGKGLREKKRLTVRFLPKKPNLLAMCALTWASKELYMNASARKRLDAERVLRCPCAVKKININVKIITYKCLTKTEINKSE